MKFVVIFLSMSMSMCTTTKPSKTTRVNHSTHKSKTVVVDSNWISKYRAAESKYGYQIDQDSEIKSVGGKYRVPQEVVDHQLDMIKAKP